MTKEQIQAELTACRAEQARLQEDMETMAADGYDLVERVTKAEEQVITLTAALRRILELTTERGPIRHEPEGALITHTGFSVQCPFCQQEVLKVAAVLRAAEGQ